MIERTSGAAGHKMADMPSFAPLEMSREDQMSNVGQERMKIMIEKNFKESIIGAVVICLIIIAITLLKRSRKCSMETQRNRNRKNSRMEGNLMN